MSMDHPREELIAALTGELPEASRGRLAAHLEGCEACRAEQAAFARIMGELRAGLPDPPAVDWGRYQAEVRGRVKARRSSWWARLGQPVPLALSASLAGVLLALTWLAVPPDPGGGDIVAFEEAALARRLDLLEQWPVVERLELLENLDVITQLDGLESEG
jgi:anti-sigma factor RsiW